MFRNIIFAVIIVGGFLSGCDNKTGIENYELALKLLDNSDKNESSEKVKNLLIKACEQDYAKACFALTHKNPLFNKNEAPKNNVQLLEKSCDLGIADACFQRGSLFSDKSKAIPFNKKGCELGHAASCHLIGHAYYTDTNIMNFRKAFKFFDKGCKLGNFWACEKVADFYYHAHGVEQDIEKYITYHEKNCSGNGNDDVISCTNLGKLYKQGGLNVDDKVTETNQSKALIYFERACQKYDSYDPFTEEACHYASKAYKEDTIVRKDLKKAKLYYERAIEK